MDLINPVFPQPSPSTLDHPVVYDTLNPPKAILSSEMIDSFPSSDQPGEVSVEDYGLLQPFLAFLKPEPNLATKRSSPTDVYPKKASNGGKIADKILSSHASDKLSSSTPLAPQQKQKSATKPPLPAKIYTMKASNGDQSPSHETQFNKLFYRGPLSSEPNFATKHPLPTETHLDISEGVYKPRNRAPANVIQSSKNALTTLATTADTTSAVEVVPQALFILPRLSHRPSPFAKGFTHPDHYVLDKRQIVAPLSQKPAYTNHSRLPLAPKSAVMNVHQLCTPQSQCVLFEQGYTNSVAYKQSWKEYMTI